MTPPNCLKGIEDIETRPDYLDDHLEIDFNGKRAFIDFRLLPLTSTEFLLLSTLVRNAGEVVPRKTLLQHVWGYGPSVLSRTLDVHIRRLRKKMGPHSRRYIETIFRIGYRFQPFRQFDGEQFSAIAMAA